MYISKMVLKDFMLFNSFNIDFSKNINIISGENSTGKTAILKLLYSATKSINEANKFKSELTKEQNEELLVSKLQGVFRPDDDKIGRLVGRIQGRKRANIALTINDNSKLEFGFSTNQEKHLDINQSLRGFVKAIEPIYLPPKEIISATENFSSLYKEYHIAFEETYFDLALLLDKPLKRGANTGEQNKILESFNKIIEGSIIQKGKKFYLKVDGQGEFEMGLVSEGYRKLSTIVYLILSGSLNKNSILFWDEPETNMNPKMIEPIVQALIVLAEMGVQIFVATHDYFIQQSFSIFSEYKTKNIDVKFISLYKNENDGISYEFGPILVDFKHNAIMQEFDNLYNREQELFYED
ncbi:MAG: AAA family ATPase [Syntrophomonas sp.]